MAAQEIRHDATLLTYERLKNSHSGNPRFDVILDRFPYHLPTKPDSEAGSDIKNISEGDRVLITYTVGRKYNQVTAIERIESRGA